MATDTETSPDPARGAGAFALHYVARNLRSFGPLVVMVLGAAACSIGVQVMMKWIVDGMTRGGAAGAELAWRGFSFFLAFIFVESLLWRSSGYLGCRATLLAGVQMRLDLFRILSGQSMRYFSEHLAGSLGQRITATAGNFGGLMNTIAWRVMPPCFDFVGALLIFLTVDAVIAAALAVSTALTTALLLLYGGGGKSVHVAYARNANAVAGDLVDVISNMWAVKAFSARRREGARLNDQFMTEAKTQRASWMYTEGARLLHDVILFCTAGLVVAYSLHLWSLGRISPGDMVLVSALTFRVLHGSRDIALALVDMGQQFGYIEETLRVLAPPAEVRDPPSAAELCAERPAVVFERVGFSYKRDGDMLRDLDFEIAPGEKVGIVGPSGAGKSTIVALLQRLYDPQRGRILVGRRDIREVTQDSLRAHLAVAPQDVHLFHRSILENIRVARPDASDADVMRVAEAAQCAPFISLTPGAYESVVGERGVKLSGGQKQRIGVARALLKRAPILILDEATSALDTKTEVRLLRAVLREAGDRTLIAVAHRLSTLAAFDRILVIAGGRVVEDGRFDDLRRGDGPFSDMWRLQVQGVLQDGLAESAQDRELASFPDQGGR